MPFQNPTIRLAKNEAVSKRRTTPPARQCPLSMASAVSAKSSRLAVESASINSSQSPVATDAPQFRAREIWLIGSKTTLAPAATAISAVRSVELLSQTINSHSHPRATNPSAASVNARRFSPNSFSSLKAGTTTETFTLPLSGPPFLQPSFFRIRPGQHKFLSFFQIELGCSR